MKTFLFSTLVLLFSGMMAGAASDPNYTGPSAPTIDLPNLTLPDSQAFVHPGLLQSQADIDFIRARIKAGEEPWTTALKAMIADPYLKLDRKPKVVPEIDCNANSVGYLMADASASYGFALLWCITGKREYADKAIETLNANSSILKAIIGKNDQPKLEAAFTGGKFASAAELLLHYKQPDGSTANWAPADAERCKTMLTTIFYPLIENFQPGFNGNWDASMVATMMCIGVVCDDHAKFNRALDYYLHGKGHGSVSHYIHSTGQSQEAGRDQSHVQLGLGALAAACEIASKQGIDLYSLADNLVAKGYEYLAKYSLGNEVEVIGDVPTSTGGRGNFMTIFEVAYQHYAIDKGVPMPFTKQVLDKKRPEGMDLIILQAWGTLTNYRGPAVALPVKEEKPATPAH